MQSAAKAALEPFDRGAEAENPYQIQYDLQAQMQNLVLAILNSADQLRANGHPKWKSSIIQTYFAYRGYEPTNQVIQTFNFLDSRGYKIIKK